MGFQVRWVCRPVQHLYLRIFKPCLCGFLQSALEQDTAERWIHYLQSCLAAGTMKCSRTSCLVNCCINGRFQKAEVTNTSWYHTPSYNRLWKLHILLKAAIQVPFNLFFSTLYFHSPNAIDRKEFYYYNLALSSQIFYLYFTCFLLTEILEMITFLILLYKLYSDILLSNDNVY